MRSWESFDVSAVARSTESPLKHVTVVALHELRLFSVFRICCTKLLRYLDVLESLYPRYWYTLLLCIDSVITTQPFKGLSASYYHITNSGTAILNCA